MREKFVALLLATVVSSPAVSESPNILILLADDLGWTGTSVQMDERVPGSKSDLYRTPNLERLASQGMRFSNAYSPAPNCSPTRMSIQTGKTAARLGATDIIDVVPEHDGLTTNAPGRQGMPDPKRTGEITERSLAFLDRHGASERPFLLQISYYAVHTPVLAKPETVSRYHGYSSVTHTNSICGAMTDELDQSVGRILDRIDALGIAGNTYVIFTSDNGGESDRPVTSNVPLSMGKTHVWEGGIRVPLIVRGPGIAAGSQSHVPAIGYDFLPTIADWLGAGDRLPDHLDGGSLAGVLANGGAGEVDRGTEPLIWYYGAYRNMKHVTPQTAIRLDQHKLIRELESGREVLYDLDLDLAETTDLSRFRPEVARRLSRMLDDYLASVDLELPTPNPEYDPTRDTGLVSVGGTGSP